MDLGRYMNQLRLLEPSSLLHLNRNTLHVQMVSFSKTGPRQHLAKSVLVLGCISLPLWTELDSDIWFSFLRFNFWVGRNSKQEEKLLTVLPFMYVNRACILFADMLTTYKVWFKGSPFIPKIRTHSRKRRDTRRVGNGTPNRQWFSWFCPLFNSGRKKTSGNKLILFCR